MPVPVELGGGGADLETVCRAQAVLAGGCASTALAANMHLFGIGTAAEAFADDEPEARILLELAANRLVIGGSFTDAATGLNVRTSATPARKVEGGYVVSGRKSFCSLAPVLDIFYARARARPRCGRPRPCSGRPSAAGAPRCCRPPRSPPSSTSA